MRGALVRWYRRGYADGYADGDDWSPPRSPEALACEQWAYVAGCWDGRYDAMAYLPPDSQPPRRAELIEIWREDRATRAGLAGDCVRPRTKNNKEEA